MIEINKPMMVWTTNTKNLVISIPKKTAEENNIKAGDYIHKIKAEVVK